MPQPEHGTRKRPFIHRLNTSNRRQLALYRQNKTQISTTLPKDKNASTQKRVKRELPARDRSKQA